MIMYARICASIINCQLSIINYHCSNMSKTASASEKPNSFEFFRAPKVFEQSSKIAQAEHKAKARFWLC